MGSVVGGQGDPLRRGETGAAGHLRASHAGEEMLQFGHRVVMRLVGDLGAHERRVGDHVVLQQDGQVDEPPRHGFQNFPLTRTPKVRGGLREVEVKTLKGVGKLLATVVLSNRLLQ